MPIQRGVPMPFQAVKLEHEIGDLRHQHDQQEADHAGHEIEVVAALALRAKLA